MSDKEAKALEIQGARSMIKFPTEEVRENAWLLWDAMDAEVAKAAEEAKP